MKILVTAKGISGTSREGGSSRLMRCVIDTLENMGHEVTATITPRQYINENFDLIICSQLVIFNEIKDNPSRKIVISHGLIVDEFFAQGADRYISVSEEVRDSHLNQGFSSEVIPQPIVIPPYSRPHKKLKNILVIRHKSVDHDPFSFLKEKYDLRYSDLDIPIEKQIKWADLCITLGRGALESMARGRPVLIADNRSYIGDYGDGYVLPSNIHEIAKGNFSGRTFRYTVTQKWIEEEIAKYDQNHSIYLYNYVKEKHEASKVVKQYIRPISKINMGFGALVNDPIRLDMVLKQSEIDGQIYFIKEPHSATSGLNKLLDIMRKSEFDVAVLTHQDMYYRRGWTEKVKVQLEQLPQDWVVAGIIGKDMDGLACGRMHDMRMPIYFNSGHSFPVEAACFDECFIFVTLTSQFWFDEGLIGFDLYGSLAVLQAKEMGKSAWIIDAWAEHYCLRPFPWRPEKDFFERVEWLRQRFSGAVIDSTAFGFRGDNFNQGDAAPERKEEETRCLEKADELHELCMGQTL